MSLTREDSAASSACPLEIGDSKPSMYPRRSRITVLQALYGLLQLSGDILVACGHETLASFETESEGEKGLDGAVVQVLRHALAFVEHLTEPCLALTQGLFGPGAFVPETFASRK